MKIQNSPRALRHLALVLLAGSLAPVAIAGEAPVELGSASDFVALAGTTLTNVSSAGTVIQGNIGVSPGTEITGFPPGIVIGSIHAGNPAAAQAQFDLTVAYNDAAGRTTAPITVSGNLGGMTLFPGLYKSTSSLEITSGDLTLDAQGDPNAVFIFQMASTFTTTSGRQIILAGGAQPDNIFWQVGSSATFGSTSIIKGNVLALVSITLNTGATLDGRALARNGAVSMSSNTITKPSPVVPPTLNFNFEEDVEGWVFEQDTTVFSVVDDRRNTDRDSLEMTVRDNTNSFATWRSPTFVVTNEYQDGVQSIARLSMEEEAAFRVFAEIYNDKVSATDLGPVVRLRASTLDFRQTHEMSISPRPNFDGLAPDEDGRLYIHYFTQPEGTSTFRLYFDVMNFSGIAAPVGTVGLSSVVLEALPPFTITSPGTLVREFNFANSQSHGFTPRVASPLRIPEVFQTTSDGLLIRIEDIGSPQDDKSVSFGYWGNETNVPFVANTLYMITWRIKTEATSAQVNAIPTIRMRVNDSSLQLSTLLVLHSKEGARLPVDGNVEEYHQWIQTPDDIAGNNWIFSFDLLWTDRPNGDMTADDPTIGVILESVRVEALAL
ncbi:MAG: DUF3494 domain-containing protein [Candidatus Sumerlaeia bacterium]|nr:DUF3494 domain-containing protein [Candidatus Sumerlaeia bacterium]